MVRRATKRHLGMNALVTSTYRQLVSPVQNRYREILRQMLPTLLPHCHHTVFGA
jgi:hypothetical protein